jgi:hypothetical protein
MRFIAKKMISFIGSRQFKKLTNKHFYLIGDKSEKNYQ